MLPARRAALEQDERHFAQVLQPDRLLAEQRVVRGRLDTIRSEMDFRDYAISAGNPFEPPAAGGVQAHAGGGGGHEDLYRDLERALVTGQPPIAPGREAAVTLELANAITYTSRTAAEAWSRVAAVEALTA